MVFGHVDIDDQRYDICSLRKRRGACVLRSDGVDPLRRAKKKFIALDPLPGSLYRNSEQTPPACPAAIGAGTVDDPHQKGEVVCIRSSVSASRKRARSIILIRSDHDLHLSDITSSWKRHAASNTAKSSSGRRLVGESDVVLPLKKVIRIARAKTMPRTVEENRDGSQKRVRHLSGENKEHQLQDEARRCGIYV